jgi:hypothetical protein
MKYENETNPITPYELATLVRKAIAAAVKGRAAA